jgi:hypothetical protein
MDPKSEKPLSLFVNPFAIWTNFAFKAGEAMWASAHAAVRANAPNVAVIPTADAAPPRAEASAAQLALNAGEATPAHAAAARANAPNVAVIPTADAPPPQAEATATHLAFKAGEAIWTAALAAAVQGNAAKVAVIPTADAPPPQAEAPVRLAAKPVQQASKAARFKAARAKIRSKARAKLRAAR